MSSSLININDEWENFISSNGEDDIEDENNNENEYSETISANLSNEICPKAKFIVLTKPDYKRAAEPEVLAGGGRRSADLGNILHPDHRKGRVQWRQMASVPSDLKSSRNCPG